MGQDTGARKEGREGRRRGGTISMYKIDSIYGAIPGTLI